MTEIPMPVRYAIYYEWKLFDAEKDKQADVLRRIHQAFGEDVLSKPTLSRYFSRFDSGDESVEDKPRGQVDRSQSTRTRFSS
jgi:HTH domain in Mos1 transposase